MKFHELPEYWKVVALESGVDAWQELYDQEADYLGVRHIARLNSPEVIEYAEERCYRITYDKLYRCHVLERGFFDDDGTERFSSDDDSW